MQIMRDSRYIILFPTQREGASFREQHPEAEVVICGVGMAQAAATMARLAPTIHRESRVILAGIAGAYDTQRYPITSVVEVVSEQIEELPSLFRRVYHIAPQFGLATARGNSVNSQSPKSKGCDVESMEGASVAAICEELSIPFSQIRAISNRVGESSDRWQIDPAINALTDELSEIYLR